MGRLKKKGKKKRIIAQRKVYLKMYEMPARVKISQITIPWTFMQRVRQLLFTDALIYRCQYVLSIRFSM